MTDDYRDLDVGAEVRVFVEWPSEVRPARGARPAKILPPGDAWCRIDSVAEPTAEGVVWYSVTPVDPVLANIGMIRHDRILGVRLPTASSSGVGL